MCAHHPHTCLQRRRAKWTQSRRTNPPKSKLPLGGDNKQMPLIPRKKRSLGTVWSPYSAPSCSGSVATSLPGSKDNISKSWAWLQKAINNRTVPKSAGEERPALIKEAKCSRPALPIHRLQGNNNLHLSVPTGATPRAVPVSPSLCLSRQAGLCGLQAGTKTAGERVSLSLLTASG